MAINYRPADPNSPADLLQAVHPDTAEPTMVVPGAAEVRMRIDAMNDAVHAIRRLDAKGIPSDDPDMQAAYQALNAANGWFIDHRIPTMWDAAHGIYTVSIAMYG